MPSLGPYQRYIKLPDTTITDLLRSAVHWVRPGCALAQSSPNLIWAAMGLRADSARPQRVSSSARTDSRRDESARTPIAAHAKFGDDCANAQPCLTQCPVDGGLYTFPTTFPNIDFVNGTAGCYCLCVCFFFVTGTFLVLNLLLEFPQ